MTTTPAPWQGPSDWQQRPLAVLGGGVLGRRIAACFLAAGRTVHIRDPSQQALDQAQAYLKENLSTFTALTDHKGDTGKLELHQSLEDAVRNCWLVIEAVPEVLAIKESTFVDLEKLAPSDCILASNSSSYKSSDLLGKVQNASTMARVLNVHFMMPPEALIVELMTSGSTLDNIFPFLTARLQEAGLHPVSALKESSGFIFNRIWAAIKREVLAVIVEGVSTPETIDHMWIEQYASRKIGPCAMMDSVGIDTVYSIEQHYVKERGLPSTTLDWLKENYIDQGKLGSKSGPKGGLYPAPQPGTQTKILLLNLGIAGPVHEGNIAALATSGQVLSLNASIPGARPTELVKNLPAPDGIDVSHSTKRIYWTNMSNVKKNDGSIQSANLDGSDIQYVLEPGKIHTPKQLHIDQHSNRIYVCDREGLRVMRCNLDGSSLETIYASGNWETEPEKKADSTCWPVGITVSKKLGKFFWTQKGNAKAGEGRIFSAPTEGSKGMDPSARNDIEMVAQGLPECIDLEVDDEEGYLYWTDRGEIPLGNTLNRKKIVGPPGEKEKPFGREILCQGLGEGIGLRLDKQNRCCYVADLGGHLWKVDVDKGDKEKVFEGVDHTYTGLAFYRV